MLPGRDGVSVLRALRDRSNAVPVLILTARGEICEKVERLDLGADDYLAEPFFFHGVDSPRRDGLATAEIPQHYFWQILRSSRPSSSPWRLISQVEGVFLPIVEMHAPFWTGFRLAYLLEFLSDLNRASHSDSRDIICHFSINPSADFDFLGPI
jgi:CheY-like chemotaxis protein